MKCHIVIARTKYSFFMFVFLCCNSLSVFSQSLPSTITTQYLQFSMGDRSGHSETNDPVKSCNDITFLNTSFQIKDCRTKEVWVNITLVTFDPTKNGDNGFWSKRYFGYDPALPSYQPDGIQILTHVITLSYNSQKNSYSLLLEIPETYKDVSFVWHFFNL